MNVSAPPDHDACPRCGGTVFTEHDCGPDSYDDDVTWAAWSCNTCGLWYSGWSDTWYVDVEWCQDEEDAEAFTAEPPS